MAHFAQMYGDIIAQVIVVNNEVLENKPFPESEPIGVAFCQSLYGADTQWKQTSYNGSFRGQYAGAGMTYHEKSDSFITDDGKTYNEKYNIFVPAGHRYNPFTKEFEEVDN
jgi:hypothetical protein